MLMIKLLDENKIVVLNEPWNIIENSWK